MNDTTQREVDARPAWVGYNTPAAAADAWRSYDAENPQPGYYEFDWLSARHPDLYDKFALTSVGLIASLLTIIDLTGLDLVDIGAGTGRATIPAARVAKHVWAIDAYRSVVEFGRSRVAEAGLKNVAYIQADRSRLPLMDSSVDAVVCAWAELDRVEASRVLKDRGLLVHMGGHPDEPGEMNPILKLDYPNLVITESHAEVLSLNRPAVDLDLPASVWPDVRLVGGVVHAHDFTYIADYGQPDEAAAIHGRLFGPRAAQYLRSRNQSAVWSRLRIYYARVAK